eukprot:SAG31_NODE_115_length_24128_cov_47.693912_10_plen_82_part_00
MFVTLTHRCGWAQFVVLVEGNHGDEASLCHPGQDPKLVVSRGMGHMWQRVGSLDRTADLERFRRARKCSAERSHPWMGFSG